MSTLKIWARALKTIPRIDRAEWDNYDIISRWLIATRSAVFIMTAISAMIGGILAWKDGNVNWVFFMVALFGLIYAIGPTSVLFGKHTDKLNEDKKKGVNTLPVILGERIARYANVGLWISQYVLVGLLVVMGTVSPVMLITLLAIPKMLWAYSVYSKPRPESEPPDLPRGVWPLYLSAHAFNYNKRFGGLFLLGLIADTILFKTGYYFVF